MPRRSRRSTRKTNIVGKSVTLVKNMAGTGANLALRVSAKTLKNATKVSKKVAANVARNTDIIGKKFLTSAKNFLRKTFKKIR